MNPRDHSLLLDISSVYRIKGDFKLALDYTKKYVNFYPNAANSYYELAWIYSYIGNKLSTKQSNS